MSRLAALALAGTIAGCAGASTERSDARAMARVEDALGPLVDAMLTIDKRVYDEDPALVAYVDRIGQRVAARAKHDERRFTFTILDDPSVEVWSTVGGRVYITRGALARLGSEAELAAVLGHEIAHVAAHHALHGFLVSAHGFKGETATAVDDDAQDTDEQFQADRLGFSYAHAAGYDDDAMTKMLVALHHGDPRAREPVYSARLARVLMYPRSAGRGKVEEQAFFDRLEGLPVGEDPRDGALRGRAFASVRAGIALDVPSGWRAEWKDHVLTAESPDEADKLGFRRLGGPRVAEVLAAKMGHAPDVALLGVHFARGSLPVKGAVQELAMFRTANGDAYAVQATGPHAREVLERTLSAARRPSADDAKVAPSRLHVRRAAIAGRLDVVARATCGAYSSATGEINIASADAHVDAGRALKCVVP